MALSKNAINGDIAMWLQANGGVRLSGSDLRLHIERMGHQAADIDQAFAEWFPMYLSRVTPENFEVSGEAGRSAIEEMLSPHRDRQ